MDDLISRKDLMKKIAHHTVHDSMSYVTFERSTVYEMVKGDMFGLVKDAPAVDTMPRWISVEERLPEPKEDVALYIRCGDVSFIRTGWRMGNGQFICPNDSLSGYEVTHWMPIPQPPKEE